MRTTALLAVLLASAAVTLTATAPTVTAAPPVVVEVPRGEPSKWVELKAQRGRLLRMSAEPASKWSLIDDDAADLLPVDGGKYADFAAPVDGRYKVIVTAPDGTPARIVVVVGDGGPVPPGPGPKPPEPPPVDPLKAKLAAAVDAEPGDAAKKAEHVADLAAVYRVIAKSASNKKLSTAGEFLSLARDSAAEMIDSKPPKGVRKLATLRDTVVAGELNAVFDVEKGPDAPLTDDQRKAAEVLFNKLAGYLEALPNG